MVITEFATDKGPEGNNPLITGFDPTLHEKAVSDEIDSSLMWVKERMATGDALVKIRDNTPFLIKKKETNTTIS